MKITINDCLTLPVFENAEILSCSDKTEKCIRHISVLEAACTGDVEREMDKTLEHHMLVTGFYGTRADVKTQCMIVEKLGQEKLSALVLHGVGNILKEVSDELVSVCDRYGIILIKLDEKSNAGVLEVIEEVSHKLFYGAADKFNNTLITSSIYHLLNFEKYADFPAAVRAAAELNAFQLVLLSRDLNPVLAIETQQKTTVERAVMKAREHAVEKRSSVYTVINVDGVVTYWGSAVINGEDYYMFVADNEDAYSIDEIIKLADIIELSIGMWKYAPASDSRSEFVKALRRGNMSTVHELQKDADIDENSILGVFAGQCEFPENILVEIDRYCAVNRLINLQVIEGDEIFGIIMAGHDSCSVPVCAKLYEELKSLRMIKMFHITGVEGASGACDGFRLINETMNAAQVVFPYKRIFSKYDLALISNCNNIQSKGGHLKKVYLDFVSSFCEDQGQKGKQLLDTLETFVLDAGMNGSKTSEIMDIHANTVQYRLKKINDVLGAELTGNRVVPGLTIALALKRLERAQSIERRKS